MAEPPDSGRDRPTLLAIHGLGATSALWAALRDELGDRWNVIAPDLPGHGAAPWSGDYTIGSLAAAVSGACDNGQEVVAVGHSLGGAVAIALASGFFRPVVTTVVAIGVKTVWTDDDVAGMAKVAGSGTRWFDTEPEASERFLRQSGLHGLVEPGDPETIGSVVEDGGRWRLAQDPGTFGQRPLDMAGLMAAARCPVTLAAGQHDPMATVDQLAAHADRPEIAAGRGHNVQVEDPVWVAGQNADAADRAGSEAAPNRPRH